MPPRLQDVTDDHIRMHKILQESGLKYVAVMPPESLVHLSLAPLKLPTLGSYSGAHLNSRKVWAGKMAQWACQALEPALSSESHTVEEENSPPKTCPLIST